MTIHSFRRVLHLRREAHAVQLDRSKPAYELPWPVALIDAVYLVALELVFLVIRHLPLIGGLTHWPYGLWWWGPVWITIAVRRIPLDGRDPHLLVASAVQHALRPRVTLAGRDVHPRARIGGRVRAHFDEHSPRLHRSRVRGPATVRFRVPVSFRLAFGVRHGFVARPDGGGGECRDYEVTDDRLEIKP